MSRNTVRLLQRSEWARYSAVAPCPDCKRLSSLNARESREDSMEVTRGERIVGPPISKLTGDKRTSREAVWKMLMG